MDFSAYLQQVWEETPADRMPLDQEQYTAVPLEEDNFNTLSTTDESVLFVDGGIQPLIQTPGMAAAAVRVAGVRFKGKEKQEMFRSEMKVVAKLHDNEYRVARLSHGEIQEWELDAHEETMAAELQRVQPISVLNLIRRLAEIQYARVWSKNDIVVLDGSLDGTRPFEYQALQQLHNKTQRVVGLCKTSSLVTTSGHALGSVLRDMGSSDPWVYAPLYQVKNKRHPAQMGMCKLSEHSHYVFRVEVFKDQQFGPLVSPLLTTAQDPVFRGYPYGLIVADQLARISNKEQQVLRTTLRLRMQELWKQVRTEEHSLDAHDILDSIY